MLQRSSAVDVFKDEADMAKRAKVTGGSLCQAYEDALISSSHIPLVSTSVDCSYWHRIQMDSSLSTYDAFVFNIEPSQDLTDLSQVLMELRWRIARRGEGNTWKALPIPTPLEGRTKRQAVEDQEETNPEIQKAQKHAEKSTDAKSQTEKSQDSKTGINGTAYVPTSLLPK